MKASETHQKIVGLLNGRNSRKVENNTYVTRQLGGAVALRFHQTDILTAAPDGTVTVTSGGWRTVTTKARLNEFLGDGLGISQRAGLWYWCDRKSPCGGDVVYSDGDKISASGRVRGQVKTQRLAVSEGARLAKRIAIYARKCGAAVPMPVPGAGDCLYCRATTTGAMLGDAMKDHGHLEVHMEESYVVPSLVLRALTEANATDFIKSAAFGQGGITGSMCGVAKHHVQSAVRNFMKRRLGLAAPGGWGNAARKDGIHGAREGGAS